MAGLGVMARGPRGESCRSKAAMHGRGKSDRPIAPGKPPNKASWDACRRRRWKDHSSGDVVIVRFSDDFVVGFEHRQDAERFYRELKDRFSTFNLVLHSGKTRIIEFGRFAVGNRKRRGAGKPETFNFLGFTHICGQTRNGKFIVVRHTMRQRLTAKIRELKRELKRRRHWPTAIVGQWLRSVALGHCRSSACTSEPKAGAQCGSSARWDLCGGCRAICIPTATPSRSNVSKQFQTKPKVGRKNGIESSDCNYSIFEFCGF